MPPLGSRNVRGYLVLHKELLSLQFQIGLALFLDSEVDSRSEARRFADSLFNLIL
jgi:hypothetical protein